MHNVILSFHSNCFLVNMRARKISLTWQFQSEPIGWFISRSSIDENHVCSLFIFNLFIALTRRQLLSRFLLFFLSLIKIINVETSWEKKNLRLVKERNLCIQHPLYSLTDNLPRKKWFTRNLFLSRREISITKPLRYLCQLYSCIFSSLLSPSIQED